MTTKIDDGGSAFPVSYQHKAEGGERITCEHHGMSLRDYFAAKAMHGELSSLPDRDDVQYCKKAHMKDLAEWSYEVADAMLAARKEGGQ